MYNEGDRMFKFLAIFIVIVFLVFVVIFILNQKDGFLLVKTTVNTPSSTPNLPQISLDSIFDSQHQLRKDLNSDEIITLIATGDVIPARSVNYQAVIRNNFKWPFEKTANFLKTGDITFINLETPLTRNCPLTQEGMIFCGSDKHIEGILLSGVDVVSLANNHSANHGKVGVDETIELLNKNGIKTMGVNEPAIVGVKGIKFGFLGFNDIEKNSVVASAEKEKIKRDIDDLKSKVDVVIVTFHWGAEYRAQPDQSQIDLGHFTIDSGADLVIGNHPHWIQPVEIYKGKLITYAHGNFVFDQEWSQKTKEGLVGKYTFFKNNLIDVEYFPVEIIDYGQPYFLEGERKQKILNEMKNESLERSRTLF